MTALPPSLTELILWPEFTQGKPDAFTADTLLSLSNRFPKLRRLNVYELTGLLTDAHIAALPRSLTHLTLEHKFRNDSDLVSQVCLSGTGWASFPPKLVSLALSLPVALAPPSNLWYLVKFRRL